MSVDEVIEDGERMMGCESWRDILSMAFAGEIEGLARGSCGVNSGVDFRLLLRLEPVIGLGVLAGGSLSFVYLFSYGQAQMISNKGHLIHVTSKRH